MGKGEVEGGSGGWRETRRVSVSVSFSLCDLSWTLIFLSIQLRYTFLDDLYAVAFLRHRKRAREFVASLVSAFSPFEACTALNPPEESFLATSRTLKTPIEESIVKKERNQSKRRETKKKANPLPPPRPLPPTPLPHSSSPQPKTLPSSRISPSTWLPRSSVPSKPSPEATPRSRTRWRLERLGCSGRIRGCGSWFRRGRFGFGRRSRW